MIKDYALQKRLNEPKINLEKRSSENLNVIIFSRKMNDNSEAFFHH